MIMTMQDRGTEAVRHDEEDSIVNKLSISDTELDTFAYLNCNYKITAK